MIMENNKDTYQRITDYVIEQLDKGEIVWQKGWNTYGLPRNAVTANTYQGWNAFFLNFVTMYNEYKTPYFLTYKQAMDKGGTIRRGQKGYAIIWWATMEDKSKIVNTNESGEAEYLQYRVPKTHVVFNIDQTYGIEFPQVEKPFRTHTEKIHACEKVINEMNDRPLIKHGGDKAYYIPSIDAITLPPVEMFHSDQAYYKTLFHELAHSTGHVSRLNRKEINRFKKFGDENYSREELTAELTAAFLSAICGIEANTINNSAAYIQGWLNQLKNDKKLILKAASQAQAAADYILNKSSVSNIKEQVKESITI